MARRTDGFRRRWLPINLQSNYASRRSDRNSYTITVRTRLTASESSCLDRGSARLIGVALLRCAHYLSGDDRPGGHPAAVGRRRSKARRAGPAGVCGKRGSSGELCRVGSAFGDYGSCSFDDRSGLKDLETAPLRGRIRREGGQGQPLTERDPTFLDDLRRIVEPATRGDPVRPFL